MLGDPAKPPWGVFALEVPQMMSSAGAPLDGFSVSMGPLLPCLSFFGELKTLIPRFFLFDCQRLCVCAHLSVLVHLVSFTAGGSHVAHVHLSLKSHSNAP